MPWTLADNQAVLSGPLLTATYDVHQPREGLRDVSFSGHELTSLHPLQVTLNPPVSRETIIETYVRGDDFVATYAQLPERTVRPQVCLRHLAAESLSGEGRAGVELIIARADGSAEQRSMADQGNGVFQATVDGLLSLGPATVSAYASDAEGDVSLPATTQVAFSEVIYSNGFE